jgi:putative FmdB family regulatory protein
MRRPSPRAAEGPLVAGPGASPQGRRIIRGFPFQIKGLSMPIYAYRCATCGHAKDVLQKMSDAVLTDCPQCGAPTFVKQVTAAGFQLKGSGWYVTDFKGDNKPAAATTDAAKADAAKPDGAKADAASGAAAKTDNEPAAAAATKGDSAPAPAAAPPAPAAPASGSK